MAGSARWGNCSCRSLRSSWRRVGDGWATCSDGAAVRHASQAPPAPQASPRASNPGSERGRCRQHHDTNPGDRVGRGPGWSPGPRVVGGVRRNSLPVLWLGTGRRGTFSAAGWRRHDRRFIRSPCDDRMAPADRTGRQVAMMGRWQHHVRAVGAPAAAKRTAGRGIRMDAHFATSFQANTSNASVRRKCSGRIPGGRTEAASRFRSSSTRRERPATRWPRRAAPRRSGPHAAITGACIGFVIRTGKPGEGWAPALTVTEALARSSPLCRPRSTASSASSRALP